MIGRPPLLLTELSGPSTRASPDVVVKVFLEDHLGHLGQEGRVIAHLQLGQVAGQLCRPADTQPHNGVVNDHVKYMHFNVKSDVHAVI